MMLLVVFIGAGIGGSICHGMNIWVARLMGTHFPYHTLVINIVGSLVMSLLPAGSPSAAAPPARRGCSSPPASWAASPPSAFSLDAVLLWERQEVLLTALYVGGSVAGALAGPRAGPLDHADDAGVTRRDFDVIVLGAGAAGLMCAITAGRRGRRVLLLDHAAEAGEKILISGGGRCNFTNLHARRSASSRPIRISAARRWRATRRGLHRAGRAARHRLPREDAGSTVLRRLGAADRRHAAGRMRGRRRRHAPGAAHRRRRPAPTASGWKPTTAPFDGRRLVLATGGLSIPKTGRHRLRVRRRPALRPAR